MNSNSASVVSANAKTGEFSMLLSVTGLKNIPELVFRSASSFPSQLSLKLIELIKN